MLKKLQGWILSLVFCLALLAGGLSFLLLPKAAYSMAERRPLAQAPVLSGSSVLNGRFFTQLNAWVTDHFQGRETFRRVKALWQLRVMQEPENNGLVVVNASIVKLERQIHEDSLAYAADRFQAVYSSCLQDSDCRLFCALIPDKSRFLAECGYPVMDPDRMEALFREALPWARPIPLADLLSLEDYYRTDTHWRQERLIPTAERLLQSMGRSTNRLLAGDFSTESVSPFLGVYAGQSALDPPPEEISYLTGGPIADCVVLDLETKAAFPMYDPRNCDPRDLYTLFLGGSKGLIRIENPAVTEPGELIVFRDSFGSSLAPLLCSEYRQVTLIDLRYASPTVLRRYLRFTDQDVLFLFSTTLMNQSQGLR